eukprot:CAMPEP_0194283772 /NCGR_PEP_ID=MMETSP0169-20130528/26103_1 /TAXON_ID=218684 /ORGANISM="Corethron pennatum, Strain L29A3" /LENGTH=193 /DNA_ID=CAMNT_0039029441 /DNA_START=152 /DNA_END=733 /DNA_ORIENTATION=+
MAESNISRRRAIAGLAGVCTATPILRANADPSIFSKLQGPLQDAIAPGHWIGQFVGLNSRTERWELPDSSPAEASSAFVRILRDLPPDLRTELLVPEFDITRDDGRSVHVRTWTKNEWLDALDVSFRDAPRGGCVATASFYATGFLPTSIPLAPVVNTAFAWFPFASPGPRGEMLQEFRLRVLKGLLVKKLQE